MKSNSPSQSCPVKLLLNPNDFGSCRLEYSEIVRYLDFCFQLDINEIVRIKKKTGKSYSEIIEHQIFLTSVFTPANKFPITIDSTDLTFGKRKWIHCPKCKRNVGKLFLVNLHFVCRKCSGLNYFSSSRHRNWFYENILRPLMRLKLLERKLNRRMRRKKIEKLSEEADSIILKLKNNSQLLLWRIEKKLESLRG